MATLGRDPLRIGVPELRGMVERPRLQRIVDCCAPGLVVLAAPAGYGKTVLASQLARHAAGSSVWLNLRGLEWDAGRLLQLLCAEITRHGHCPLAENDAQHATSCDTSACVAFTRSRPLTVVLDDVSPAIPASIVCAGLEHLSAFGPAPESVVVTTRALSAEWIAALSPRTVIGVEGLELSAIEAGEVFDRNADDSVASSLVDLALDLSHGHAATLAVLARQGDALLAARRPRMDLSAHLISMATAQLEADEMETLCLASLCGMGTARALGESLSRGVGRELMAAAAAIPLFQYPLRDGTDDYCVHALAAAVYGTEEFAASAGLDYATLLDRAQSMLADQGEWVRLFELVLRVGDPDRAMRAVLLYGEELLADGGVELALDALSLVPTRLALGKPRVLLLYASALRERMELAEAMSKASVAYELAQVEEDIETAQQSLMLLARIQIDRGLIREASSNLQRLLDECGQSMTLSALAASHLSACQAFLGEAESAQANLCRAARHLDASTADAAMNTRAAIAAATVEAYARGRWGDALQRLLTVRGCREIPLAISAQVELNIGAALIEVGRYERASQVLQLAAQLAERHGLRMLEISCRDSQALIAAAQLDYDEARRLMDQAIGGSSTLDDVLELSQQYSYGAMFLRAAGQHDDSLRWAETALELSVGLQHCWPKWMSSLEVAASILAQGDPVAAVRQANHTLERYGHGDSDRCSLTADLILAAAELLHGDFDASVARLRRHSELIAGEHSNFLLTMYVRAFPALLLPLVSLHGQLPMPLASSLAQDSWESALSVCECVEPHAGAKARRALERMRGKRAAAHRPCRVKLFGGLEVRVGDRQVREKDWRKRKARLLFALMVLQRGRDMSREQVCDLLWPELDSERARNNFYVIWSIMKNALVPDGKKGAPLEYADNTGGLCRIDLERVDSDIEEFARCITSARDAESNGDSASALKCYHALVEVYRGDLLPGDVYEDFFASARDRYRMEFCDAMRRAVACAERLGEHAAALEFARRGLDTDPLSEDLYQAVMRSHIECGRRSAAIDAYFLCRQRLCDDLGLDPSSETMRLYDRILAMEENEPDPEMDG